VISMYFELNVILSCVGAPRGDDAGNEFPHGGVGFAPRETGEYRGVLKDGFESDAKIDIATCSGKRALVLTDRGIAIFGNPERVPRTRFDIDIPDNTLTINVVDTFTRMPLSAATL